MTDSPTTTSQSSLNGDLIIDTVNASAPLTNSIVITDLPEELFNSQDELAKLRDLVSQAGNIINFTALKSFRRIIIIFDNFRSAYISKSNWHNTQFEGVHLNIYLLEFILPPNSNNGIDNQSLLQVDQFEQLFWLSPPPSPPSDWQPQIEEGPNTKTLANDLMAALSKLELEEEDKEISCESPITQFRFEDTNLPTIIVEDVDPNTINFIDKARLPKTSLPPPPLMMPMSS